MTTPCPRLLCGGSLVSEWDSDLRRNVVKCLQCGREPQKEKPVETNGTAAVQPTPRRNMPEMPIGTATSADPLSLYTQAARRLLDAQARRLKAQSELASAEADIERTRREHDTARARLDEVIGGAKATAAAGVCKRCGKTEDVKRGFCVACHRERAQEGWAKRKADKAPTASDNGPA